MSYSIPLKTYYYFVISSSSIVSAVISVSVCASVVNIISATIIVITFLVFKASQLDAFCHRRPYCTVTLNSN